MKLLSLLSISILAISTSVSAQGFGGDSTTKLLEQMGLFTPHSDICDTSETFITVKGSELGFCMENSERSAQEFEAARRVCVDLGKRLPEPVEFKVACNEEVTIGTNLTQVTNNWEWASNSVFYAYSSAFNGINAAVAGNPNCDALSQGIVGNNPSSADSFSFRCVR
jgi:hypothetical protein